MCLCGDVIYRPQSLCFFFTIILFHYNWQYILYFFCFFRLYLDISGMWLCAMKWYFNNHVLSNIIAEAYIACCILRCEHILWNRFYQFYFQLNKCKKCIIDLEFYYIANSSHYYLIHKTVQQSMEWWSFCFCFSLIILLFFLFFSFLFLFDKNSIDT